MNCIGFMLNEKDEDRGRKSQSHNSDCIFNNKVNIEFEYSLILSLKYVVPNETAQHCDE